MSVDRESLREKSAGFWRLGRVGVGGREGCFRLESRMLISLRLRTNYVIRVMRIKDKGDIDKFK